jgi:hypothetical protein
VFDRLRFSVIWLMVFVGYEIVPNTTTVWNDWRNLVWNSDFRSADTKATSD